MNEPHDDGKGGKPKPEGVEDLCVYPGDIPPSCGHCEYRENCASLAKVDPHQLTMEPCAPPMMSIAADISTVFTMEELKTRFTQDMTSTLHRQSVDKFKASILRHIELNQTKGLDACTAIVIYLQLMLIPPGVLGVCVVQLVNDCVSALQELSVEAIHVSFSTPIGMRPN